MTSTDASRPESAIAAAQLLAVLGDHEEPGDATVIAELLQESLALTPDVAAIHTSLARCLVELGCVREASRHLRRALELDPLASETRRRLAAIHVHEGEIPEALELYRSAPGGATSVPLQTEHADLLARLGLAEDAAALYRGALARREYAPAAVNLGILHARRGEPDRAAACFAHAVALDATCGEAVLNLANAYVELGRLDEAERMFLRLDEDAALRGAARLGRSAIASARGEPALASELRRAAALADGSLAGLCESCWP